ncbi:MAG: GAF domain-containing protein [Thermoplasmatota archaeon]
MIIRYEEAEKAILTILQNRKEKGIQEVVTYLNEHFPCYNWVGIYIVKGDHLHLGPWKGQHPTEHTSIPIGLGVCGSAAQTGKTEVIDDVHADTRYLACFLSTRSEIVVPIKHHSVVIGEIDIDSDTPHAFTRQDIIFLEKIADMLKMHIHNL